MANLGLYLHIPFCERKCAYCDFYSAFANDDVIDNYTTALINEIKQWGGKINRPIDTIYLGGGTPSLLNERLIKVLNAVRENFNVISDAEITLELNPASNIDNVLKNAKISGVNRISIGIQSGIDNELLTLGRTHTVSDAKTAVFKAKENGFDNISVDLMLGLPNSNLETFKQSLDFVLSLQVQHVSAYILKIEEKTKFFKMQETLNLPDEDTVCEQYLLMCEILAQNGFSHYEISNFAKENFESRHNLKYWQNKEYLGIGPAAHSYIDGKRFYYPRDLKMFFKNPQTVPDGDGGCLNEQIMLSLRLKDGIKTDDLSPKALEKCEKFAQLGLGVLNDNNFSLTDRGMLVSNSIICDILEEF